MRRVVAREHKHAGARFSQIKGSLNGAVESRVVAARAHLQRAGATDEAPGNALKLAYARRRNRLQIQLRRGSGQVDETVGQIDAAHAQHALRDVEPAQEPASVACQHKRARAGFLKDGSFAGRQRAGQREDMPLAVHTGRGERGNGDGVAKRAVGVRLQHTAVEEHAAKAERTVVRGDNRPLHKDGGGGARAVLMEHAVVVVLHGNDERARAGFFQITVAADAVAGAPGTAQRVSVRRVVVKEQAANENPVANLHVKGLRTIVKARRLAREISHRPASGGFFEIQRLHVPVRANIAAPQQGFGGGDRGHHERHMLAGRVIAHCELVARVNLRGVNLQVRQIPLQSIVFKQGVGTDVEDPVRQLRGNSRHGAKVKRVHTQDGAPVLGPRSQDVAECRVRDEVQRAVNAQEVRSRCRAHLQRAAGEVEHTAQVRRGAVGTGGKGLPRVDEKPARKPGGVQRRARRNGGLRTRQLRRAAQRERALRHQRVARVSGRAQQRQRARTGFRQGKIVQRRRAATDTQGAREHIAGINRQRQASCGDGVVDNAAGRAGAVNRQHTQCRGMSAQLKHAAGDALPQAHRAAQRQRVVREQHKRAVLDECPARVSVRLRQRPCATAGLDQRERARRGVGQGRAEQVFATAGTAQRQRVIGNTRRKGDAAAVEQLQRASVGKNGAAGAGKGECAVCLRNTCRRKAQGAVLNDNRRGVAPEHVAAATGVQRNIERERAPDVDFARRRACGIGKADGGIIHHDKIDGAVQRAAKHRVRIRLQLECARAHDAAGAAQRIEGLRHGIREQEPAARIERQ